MNSYNDSIHLQQLDNLKRLFLKVVVEGRVHWQRLQATLGEAVDLVECADLIAKALRHFSTIDFQLGNSQIDVLGNAYEYIISQFARSYGLREWSDE